MVTPFESLLIGHLIGDFILQNDDMQAKSRSSWACTYHVAMYSSQLIVWGHAVGHVPLLICACIAIQHWFQDRFALHLKWMKWFGHTTPDKWPMGPLCVDQTMHIWFMAVMCLC